MMALDVVEDDKEFVEAFKDVPIIVTDLNTISISLLLSLLSWLVIEIPLQALEKP
jgi:hypothetical protein